MVEITWLGHGTFKFRLDSGEVLVMDPWIEGNPSYPRGREFERVDALLIAIQRAARFEPKVVGIYETCHWLESLDDGKIVYGGEAAGLAPAKVVPMHFGTFPPLTGRPSELASLIGDLPGAAVWELVPGKPVEW